MCPTIQPTFALPNKVSVCSKELDGDPGIKPRPNVFWLVSHSYLLLPHESHSIRRCPLDISPGNTIQRLKLNMFKLLALGLWSVTVLALSCSDQLHGSDVACHDLIRSDGSADSVLVHESFRRSEGSDTAEVLRRGISNSGFFDNKDNDKDACGGSSPIDDPSMVTAPRFGCEVIGDWARDHPGVWKIKKDYLQHGLVALIQSDTCVFFVAANDACSPPDKIKLGNTDVRDLVLSKVTGVGKKVGAFESMSCGSHTIKWGLQARKRILQGENFACG
ncbi:hypothetical protein F4780DRAFT_762870 [Xylariomycetidae sp. FL0641]|nr:hypothetical protein F4780DRAFT_762870 [Xylariomycetidae sp. FL0641]